VAEAQKAGGVCAFVDASTRWTWATRKLGVRTDDLLLAQPDCGEQALDIVEMLVKSDAVDVIVVDSVAALVPRAELEGEMGDSHMGLHARLMSQALRKLTALTARSKTLIIFINQLRMKIGVMFGNPETTTGGNALKFYASVRLDIRRIGALKDGEQVRQPDAREGGEEQALAPLPETELDIFYGHGISRAGEAIDLGVEAGILEKSGAWIGYGGERLGNGRDAARQHLLENQNLFKELRTKLLEHAGIGVPSSSAPAAPTVATSAPAPAAAGESPKPATRAKVEKADSKAALATKAA
jgi:recombination protein RecA